MTQYTRLDRTTGPAQEPLSLAEVRDHLNIDHEDDDAYLSGLIIAAREACENYTSRSLITQTWTMYLRDWPSARGEPWWDGTRYGAITELDRVSSNIELPNGPIIAITSIKTFDDADAETLVASSTYYAQPGDDGGAILRVGSTWPAATRITDGVEIVYTAGYGDSWNDIPYLLRHGMRILIAEWYERRENVVTGTIVARLPFGSRNAWSAYRLKVV